MNLSELQRLAALPQYSADPVLLEMMPYEMQQIVQSGPSAIQWSHEQLVAMSAMYVSVSNELRDLRAAIARYATEAAGMDPMFQRNIELCLQMVRKGK